MSKFLRATEDNSDDEDNQQPASTKFFKNQDIEEEEEAPKGGSKFFGKGSDDNEEDEEEESGSKAKGGSKFFGKGKDDDEEDEPDSKPKGGSKFFGKGKGDDDEEEESDSKTKGGSKFFGKNNDDDDKKPSKGKGKDKGKGGSKFFGAKKDDDDEEVEDNSSKAKGGSKFFGTKKDDDEEEEDTSSKAKGGSKFLKNQDDDKEEEKEKDKKKKGGANKNNQKNNKKQTGGSKFLQNVEEDEEEAPAKSSKFFQDVEEPVKNEENVQAKAVETTQTKAIETTQAKAEENTQAKAADQEGDEDLDDLLGGGDKKLSKAAKRRLRAKQKGTGKPEEAEKAPITEEKKPEPQIQKEIVPEKKEPEPVKQEIKEEVKGEESEGDNDKGKPDAKGAKAKKDKKDTKKDNKASKKMSAAAKLAAEKLQQKKLEEEMLRKQQEEAERLELERIRKEQEELERIKAEKEKKKKEKEERIAQLKAENKYISKKDKAKVGELERVRQQLIESGFKIEALSSTQQEEDNKPKSKVVFTRKKKKEGKNESVEQQQKVEQAEEAAQTKEEQKMEAESTELNWESMLDDSSKDEKPATDITKIEVKPVTGITNIEVKSVGPPLVMAADAKIKANISDTKQKPNVEPKQDKPKPDKLANNKQKGKEKLEESKNDNDINLRSPICCILGHVDTGKTKLLDKIRNTNVQEDEAGGITQQIGATFFPLIKLTEEISKLDSFYPVKIQVPGLLIIDTPGHESFSNLRSRGSGLCDIAILVIDIMHGLQKQTLESIELLKFRKTPYVIALNKIDRMYGWKSNPDSPSFTTLKAQDKNAQLEFRDRAKGIITALAEKGLNAALYYENPDPNTFASIIPTSAITGEGIPDLLGVVINLTQKWLKGKIKLKEDEFKCTVLEVKVIEGLGTTVDVILVNGTLHVGDKIMVAGLNGPVITSIRALLTPHPMKEMRVKNEYERHDELKASMGIKICANDLETALAGSELYVIKDEADIERYTSYLIEDLNKIKKTIELVSEGVCVAASTLGSLEALLQFLKASKIPVANISIGPVSKEEVIKAMKPLLTEDTKVKKEYATILAFDVKVLPEAQEFADNNGVKIFTANIIYHLFDHFTAYLAEIKEQRKREEGKAAIFPCILKPVAFFNKKDPLVMGVDVVDGVLRLGTILCVPEKEKLKLGVVDSIEREHKPLQQARSSEGSVAIRIKGDTAIMAGRHFEIKDKLVSMISRESIDALKEHFKDEMTKSDWDLVRKLKPMFNII